MPILVIGKYENNVRLLLDAAAAACRSSSSTQPGQESQDRFHLANQIGMIPQLLQEADDHEITSYGVFKDSPKFRR